MAHAYGPNHLGVRGQGIHELKVNLGKVNKTLYQKQNTNERAGGMTQVVECLPSIQKDLGSIPGTEKKININRAV
jgi:hypothetical protein